MMIGHPYRTYNKKRELYRLMTRFIPFTERPTFTEWQNGVRRRKKPKGQAKRVRRDIGSY